MNEEQWASFGKQVINIGQKYERLSHQGLQGLIDDPLSMYLGEFLQRGNLRKKIHNKIHDLILEELLSMVPINNTSLFQDELKSAIQLLMACRLSFEDLFIRIGSFNALTELDNIKRKTWNAIEDFILNSPLRRTSGWRLGFMFGSNHLIDYNDINKFKLLPTKVPKLTIRDKEKIMPYLRSSVFLPRLVLYPKNPHKLPKCMLKDFSFNEMSEKLEANIKKQLKNCGFKFKIRIASIQEIIYLNYLYFIENGYKEFYCRTDNTLFLAYLLTLEKNYHPIFLPRPYDNEFVVNDTDNINDLAFIRMLPLIQIYSS